VIPKFAASVAVFLSLLASSGWAADAVKPASDPLIVQGDKRWADGRLDEARKSFELAVAANPKSVPARMKLGGFQLATRSYSAAVTTYQGTISLDANNALAWVGLGMAYRHSSEPELARAAFAEAIRIDPARKGQLAQLAEEPQK
jgi:cytochrome c-type biogenesis protein CcmH/NrfG